MKANSLDALLINKEANVSYLCAYTCRDSYLLISKKNAYFITDFRYSEEIKKNLKGITVIEYKSIFKDISRLIKDLKLRRIGFESRALNYAEYSRIKSLTGPKARLIGTFNLVESSRLIKDAGELKRIKKAAAITNLAFDFIQKNVKPGMKELEIAAEIERFIRYKGARASSFNIMIASGPNSSLPHAPITNRKVRAREPILIDMGVDIEGYKSDLTRVIFLDKILPVHSKIYRIVQDAKNKAIEAVKPGEPISKIDKTARDIISKNGFSRFFGHSLGHGVGLEVHEEPVISSKNQLQTLQEGMVFTIEPGIYLPGRFGIRLEDMVSVAKKGAELLSGDINKPN